VFALAVGNLQYGNNIMSIHFHWYLLVTSLDPASDVGQQNTGAFFESVVVFGILEGEREDAEVA
jgi:hypothetical protein